jgi:hypothetical protein
VVASGECGHHRVNELRLGVLVSVIARGDKMQVHAMAEAQAQKDGMDEYIRSVAQSEPPQS